MEDDDNKKKPSTGNTINHSSLVEQKLSHAPTNVGPDDVENGSSTVIAKTKTTFDNDRQMKQKLSSERLQHATPSATTTAPSVAAAAAVDTTTKSNTIDNDKQIKQRELELRQAPALAGVAAAASPPSGVVGNNVSTMKKPGAVYCRNDNQARQKDQLHLAPGVAVGTPCSLEFVPPLKAGETEQNNIVQQQQGKPKQQQVLPPSTSSNHNNNNNNNNNNNVVLEPGAYSVGNLASAQSSEFTTTGGFSSGDNNNSNIWTNVVAHLVSDSNSDDDDNDNNNKVNSNREVVIAEQLHETRKICGIPRKRFFGLILLLINIIVGYTFFHILYIRRRREESSLPDTLSPTISPSIIQRQGPTFQIFNQPILQSVKDRGILRCRASSSEVRKGEGLTIDLCTAIAGAIFNDPINAIDYVEFVSIPFGQQFKGLWNNTIDVSSAQTTYNMQRDIYEPSIQLPMLFTIPFLYSGMVFVGIPEYVNCADKYDTLIGVCRQLSICVQKNTNHNDILNSLLSGITINDTPSHTDEVIQTFVNNTCNVFAIDQLSWLSAKERIIELNYTKEFVIGSKLHSFEPLALVTKGDDYEWLDFCNWILQSLITAEAYDITQEIALSTELWSSSIDELLLLQQGDNKNNNNNKIFETTTSIFGNEYQNMFRNAIASVGNYGEIFERNLETRIARDGAGRTNTINNGTTGLFYPDPFGVLSVDDDDDLLNDDNNNRRTPDPISGGILESIVERGILRCGIIGGNNDDDATTTIFASLMSNNNNNNDETTTTKKWFGIDIEYCRAISSAIFQAPYEIENQDDNIQFINVGSNVQDGYIALTNNEIDVLAGGSITLSSDIKEMTTNEGYVFSRPYLYYNDAIISMDDNNNNNNGSSRSLVTTENDKQWSSFVNWIIIATIYAEEQGITQGINPLDMPIVELFGLHFLQMFRDVIVGVGNYNEIFIRTITEPYNITRFGRNLLNVDGGPQLVSLPLV